jgi:Xaa-Pro aminopeptidase
MIAMDTRDSDQALDAQLRCAGPMNRQRALAVMEEHDLAGFVLGDPLNVFHALGYWPQIALTKAGQPPTSFALLSRDPGRAPGLVTTQFIYYYTWADGGFQALENVWLFDGPGDDGGDAPAPPAKDLCADRGLVALTSVERRRRAALDAVPASRQCLHDAGAALVQALREFGLWRGRLAFDHAAIAAVCAHHDRPGTMIAADNILRQIRLVKSPLEIALMRRAAAANVAAVHAVASCIRAGAGYGELRQQFSLEAARRGNRDVFLTLDRVSSELSDDRVRDGQVLFIDGVSHYRHYHGDYARTVFVGEPNPVTRRAAAAAAMGWDAVRDQLRPGLRYSDITRIGSDAVKSAGFDFRVSFGPHSVGLMHTDEPGLETQGFYRKADLVLQENMILSVDCPVLDTGVGGSAHLEDLMLITANGAVPIHALPEPVIQV